MVAAMFKSKNICFFLMGRVNQGYNWSQISLKDIQTCLKPRKFAESEGKNGVVLLQP
jgi:hypothetical protein